MMAHDRNQKAIFVSIPQYLQNSEVTLGGLPNLEFGASISARSILLNLDTQPSEIHPFHTVCQGLSIQQRLFVRYACPAFRLRQTWNVGFSRMV